MDAILLEIIRRFGGQVKLALALGISQGAVSQWRRVPVHHCLKLSQLTGIPLYEMRPDVYPMPIKKRARAASIVEEISV